MVSGDCGRDGCLLRLHLGTDARLGRFVQQQIAESSDEILFEHHQLFSPHRNSAGAGLKGGANEACVLVKLQRPDANGRFPTPCVGRDNSRQRLADHRLLPADLLEGGGAHKHFCGAHLRHVVGINAAASENGLALLGRGAADSHAAAGAHFGDNSAEHIGGLLGRL